MSGHLSLPSRKFVSIHSQRARWCCRHRNSIHWKPILSETIHPFYRNQSSTAANTSGVSENGNGVVKLCGKALRQTANPSDHTPRKYILSKASLMENLSSLFTRVVPQQRYLGGCQCFRVGPDNEEGERRPA